MNSHKWYRDPEIVMGIVISVLVAGGFILIAVVNGVGSCD